MEKDDYEIHLEKQIALNYFAMQLGLKCDKSHNDVCTRFERLSAELKAYREKKRK